MIEKALEIAKSYEEAMIKDIGRLVAIRSAKEEAREGMPFGPGPAKALNEALALASEMGFETVNLDNYCGYARLGSGEEIIGILAHVDVVPEGKGWTSPPYEATVVGSRLQGRGTSDDKGPAVMVLYAMKMLGELGIEPKKEIRLVLGANEESGMACMRHYLEVEGDNFAMGFSPDAAFPLIFGEKGGYHCMLSAPLKNEGEVKIASLKAGEAFNIVCPEATVELSGPGEQLSAIAGAFAAFAKAKAPESASAMEEGLLKITAVGKAAHASTPQLGLNAISLLFEFLAGYVSEAAIDAYNALIGYEGDGASAGMKKADEYGELTLCVGMAGIEEGSIYYSIDIRNPITLPVDAGPLKQAMEAFGVEAKMENASGPLFVDPATPFIQALAGAYKDVSGDVAHEPFTIGGGTYSRAFSNCVAFGAEFPDTDNHIHSADEFIDLGEMVTATAIYAVALARLLEL